MDHNFPTKTQTPIAALPLWAGQYHKFLARTQTPKHNKLNRSRRSARKFILLQHHLKWPQTRSGERKPEPTPQGINLGQQNAGPRTAAKEAARGGPAENLVAREICYLPISLFVPPTNQQYELNRYLIK